MKKKVSQSRSGQFHIFVVEDNEDTCAMVLRQLNERGYKTSSAHMGLKGFEDILNVQPDLVLLDLMLPDSDGYDICQKLKSHEQTRHIPIIIVSAKGDEEDIIKCLDAGAQDYVNKPFNLQVLLSRVNATLRSAYSFDNALQQDDYEIDGIYVNKTRFLVKIQGDELKLTKTEFAILDMFINSPDRVYTRSQIVDRVNGVRTVVTDRSVDFHITNLRKKLGDLGKRIQTIWGVGYRYSLDSTKDA